MHTETDGTILNSIQPEHHHQQEHTPHQQHYMTLISQDQIMPEQHQQQVFTHLPSTTRETTIALSEGYYTPTPQQHLTSECLSHGYSGTSSQVSYPSTSSPSSSSSSSNSSSDESNFSCPRPIANQNCKNNTDKHTASIGVNLRVTGQCSQGGRKYMEDYFSVAYQQSENAKDLEYAFIGIYDGHGGAEAAKFAKEHLMMEIINQRLFWSDNDHDVLRAIREGYIATHYAMWREQDKWPKTANGLPSTAGTTATVAFIRREKIYIGHVGDSGIVLGYQNENENFWRAKQLTVDHKPESVEERTRIMNTGGKVVVKSGVPRVVWNRPRNAGHRGPIRKKTVIDEIPFLAVARSLGDLWSYNSQRNEFVVSPDPDVKVIPINSNTFRCLIFGTDGLWNVVSAQAAVNTVHDKEMLNERLLAQRDDRPFEGHQLTNPSKSLVDQALHTWSNKKMRADNTSVVTVILYPPGQVDHGSNTGCKEMHKAANNPPAFLQPVSYGLEYTQVQAEIPVYDDATTYKEMALKYLAPEAYRNFNYYAEESDTEGNDNEESEGEEYDVMLTAKPPPGDLQQNTNYQQDFSTSNNWKWEDDNTNNYTISRDRQGEEEELKKNDHDDEEEDEENVKDQATKEKHANGNQRQVCIINYENFVRNEAEETNNATDSYITTFAESYNSLLTASQDNCVTNATTSSSPSSICSNSNSNSNSNCQSVTPPNMHAILQEQQLYQQQCMSEEEGYSLTKLETRREQQTCSSRSSSSTHLLNESTAAVQTFKIFHDLQGQILPQNTQQIELYHNTARFYHQQQQQFMPKPLELHSLLQQEREEEQQVAYELLQMENKLQQHHQNISAYACLQTTNSIKTPLEEQPSVEVEYLEEEDSVAAEEIISTETDNSCLLQDESVQINEISSSSCVDESRTETSYSEFGLGHSEIIEKIEILPNAIIETDTVEYSEDIKNDIFKSSNYSSLTPSNNSTCLPSPSPPKIIPAPSTLALISSIKPGLNRNKRTKSSYLYNNVPNENLQRISNSKYNHSMYFENEPSRTRKRSMCLTNSASKTSSVTQTPPAATSTPIIQRQLRSTATHPNTPNATPIMDYGKRTLRTRNSLSKDMKSKSVLVKAVLKYPQNTATRNFLRKTGANLIAGKPLHLNDINVTACKRRSLGTANNVRTPNHSRTTRREKANVVFNGSLNQCKANIQNSSHPHLNLRSRHMTTSPSSAAASTPVIKRASITERRILRSSPSKGSQTPANFSKSTRTQSTGSNLAAPPPSPKLINAVAAVAAATRARSLLNSKHAAATNGTQSVVSAVFGKRSSLRSNGIAHPNANISSSLSPSASTHQTLKGRIVKKLKR